MRSIIIVITLISFAALTGCTGVKSVTRGLENESFLELVGNPKNYKGGVDVNVDDKTTFKAEVNKDHQDRPKGMVYAISPGAHIVTLSYNNQVIYKQQIFISTQETKKITLP
ncbi:MAG: hypothetical protein WBA61_10875 [Aequorivita sp.]